MDINLIKYKQNQLAIRAKQIEDADSVRLAAAKASGKPALVRHKVFISYHAEDIDAVTKFVEDFSDVFIPRVVGASDSDYFADPIDSTKTEYIKKQIRDKYLRDSTVTIVYVGKCTSVRKFVDWEIASTLRDDTKNKLSGLIAILPSGKTSGSLPERVSDNWVDGKPTESYAAFYKYPATKESLRSWIDAAFYNRDSKKHLRNNTRELRQRNGTCTND